MHQRLECPTAETLEILLTHVAPDLGSDQQFKVLPKASRSLGLPAVAALG